MFINPINSSVFDLAFFTPLHQAQQFKRNLDPDTFETISAFSDTFETISAFSDTMELTKTVGDEPFHPKINIKPPEDSPTLQALVHRPTMYFSKEQGQHLRLSEGALLFIKSRIDKEHPGGYSTVISRKRGNRRGEVPWTTKIPNQLRSLVVFNETHPVLIKRSHFNRYLKCGKIKDHLILERCVVRAELLPLPNPINMDVGLLIQKVEKKERKRISIINEAPFIIINMIRPYYFSKKESEHLLLTQGAILFFESEKDPSWSGWSAVLMNKGKNSESYPFKVHCPYFKKPFSFPHPYKVTRCSANKTGKGLITDGTLPSEAMTLIKL